MSHSDSCDWWFGEDDLEVRSLDGHAEWTEDPFDALEFGKGLTLYRRNREGQIDRRDASVLLSAFGCYEARRLTYLWNAPEVVQEYLRTGAPHLSELATVAVRAALDEADRDMQNAAQVLRVAEEKCPKSGLVGRLTTPAAGWAAARDYARATIAYHHRVAVMHAIGAALFATLRGTCEGARSIADEVSDAAAILAAEEGVIIVDANRGPELLPAGVAQSTGRLTARVNIRSRFSAMVDQLFSGHPGDITHR